MSSGAVTPDDGPGGPPRSTLNLPASSSASLALPDANPPPSGFSPSHHQTATFGAGSSAASDHASPPLAASASKVETAEMIISSSAVSDSLESEKYKKTDSCFKKTCNFLAAFLASPRTERAVRQMLFSIPALLISYHEWVDENINYSCALLYILLSALIPPLISGISITGTVALGSSVLGMCLASSAWAISCVPNLKISKRAAMYLMYLPWMLLVAPLKIGPAKSVTQFGSLMAIYSSELGFLVTFSMFEKGIGIQTNIEHLNDLLHSPVWSTFPIPSIIPKEYPKVFLESMQTAIPVVLQSGKQFNFEITLPPEMGEANDAFAPLQYVNTYATLSKNGFAVDIPPGLWLVRLAWLGKRQTSIFQGILVYGAIALGLFWLSLLMPPQRYAKSWLRLRAAVIAKEAAAVLSLMSVGIQLMTQKMASKAQQSARPRYKAFSRASSKVSDPIFLQPLQGDDRALAETDYRPVVLSRNPTGNPTANAERSKSPSHVELPVLSLVGKRTRPSQLFSNQSSFALGPASRSASVAMLYPTFEEAQKATEMFLREEKDGRHDSEELQEKLSESIRCCVIDLESLTPLLIVSAFEPSISNPGIFNTHIESWPGVMSSLKRCFIHFQCFWDLANPLEAKLREAETPKKSLEDSPFCSPATAAEISTPQKGITPFESLAGYNTEILACVKHTAMKAGVASIGLLLHVSSLIAMRPATRGSQKLAIAHGVKVLQFNTNGLLKMQQQLLSEAAEAAAKKAVSTPRQIKEDSGKGSPNAPLQPMPSKVHVMSNWRRGVGCYATFLEFNQAFLEGPLLLASAVERLLAAETTIKVGRGLAFNVLGWFLPLLILIATMVRSLLKSLMPWKWRWRLQHQRYLGTGQPWYRDSDVLFCYRWVIGLMALLAIPVFSETFRTWYVTGSASPDPFVQLLSQPLTTKLAAWMSLGFITTLFFTVEGTLHRASLRALGVTCGTLLAYAALGIFGTRGRTGHIIWLIVTIFISTWIGSNPVSALLGFHPSWGYACQLFTYQEAIIMIEAYHRIQTPGELVVSRFLAQAIGIASACLLACVFLPNQANTSIPQCLVQCLYCSTQSVVAFTECLMQTPDPRHFEKGQDLSQPSISAPRSWENENVLNRGNRFLRKFKAMFVRSGRVPQQQKDEGPPLLWRRRRQMFFSRAAAYHADALAALAKVSDQLKDATVFRELPIVELEPRWHDAILASQFTSFHQKALFDVSSSGDTAVNDSDDSDEDPRLKAFTIAPECPAKEQLEDLMRALVAFSNVVEGHIAEEVRGWYPGYGLKAFYTLFSWCRCVRRRWERKRAERARRLVEAVKGAYKNVLEALEKLGTTYDQVFVNNDAVKKQTNNNTTAGGGGPKEATYMYGNKIRERLGLTEVEWVWLVSTQCLLRHTHDVCRLVDSLVGEDAATSY